MEHGREIVSAAGIDDEEFDRVFEEAREQVWQEKQGRRA